MEALRDPFPSSPGARVMRDNSKARREQARLYRRISRALDRVPAGPLGPFTRRRFLGDRDGGIRVTLILSIGIHHFCARDTIRSGSDYVHVRARCDMLTMALSELHHKTTLALLAE